MKKIIISLIIAVACLFIDTGVKAQVQQLNLSGTDTLTNAQADTVNITIGGTKSSVTFQADVIKLTGTVAGTFEVWASAYGTKYAKIYSDTLTNATNQYSWSNNYNGYAKYRVIVATTGTSTASVVISTLYR